MMLAINIARASCGSEKEQSGCVLSGVDADARTSIGGRGCSGLSGANKLCEITYITLFTAAQLHTFKKQSQKTAKWLTSFFSQSSLLQLGFLDVRVT